MCLVERSERLVDFMSNTNSDQGQASYEYGGYAAQQQPIYSANSQGETPQRGYPHTGYAPADVSGYQQQDTSQQQQQQMTSQQQQYYQPPFTTPIDVSPYERTSMGMKARHAGMLSYLFGWVTGLVVLLLERDNRFARFHAMQSVLFFGFLGILDRVLSWMPFGFDHSIDTVIGIVTIV